MTLHVSAEKKSKNIKKSNRKAAKQEPNQKKTPIAQYWEEVEEENIKYKQINENKIEKYTLDGKLKTHVYQN